MEQHPSIDFLGITISEPVTMLTDFVLAGFCLYYYFRLKNIAVSDPAKKYFSYYFLIMAIGTFLGGLLGHGLQPYLGMPGKYPSWIATILTMSYLLLASVELLPNGNKNQKSKFLWLTIILAVLFLSLALYNKHFSYVIYHNIAAAVVMIPIFIYLYIKFKMKGTDWILFSFIISTSIPYFQINRIGFNKWFTYHDVCHTIMLVGLSLLFYGAYIILKHIEFTQRTTS